MARIGKVMIKKLAEDNTEMKASIYFEGKVIGEMNSSIEENYQIESVTLKLNPHYMDMLNKEATNFFHIYKHAFSETCKKKMEQLVTYLKILAALDALEDSFRDICDVTNCNACLYIEYENGTSFMPAERRSLEQIESILKKDKNVSFVILMDKDTFDIRPDEMSAKDFYLMHILH